MGQTLLQRPRISRPEPRFASMLGISLGVHLLVVMLFAGVLIPRMDRDPRPVYVVDLVNLPVANPQAGRPDARPAPPKPAPKPEAPAKVVRPEPKPEPKPQPKPEPKPVAKTPPKPAAKPKPLPKPEPKASYQDTLSAIEKIKRQKEIDQLKQSLATLQNQDTRQLPAVKAPLGEEKGTGTESGVGLGLWLQSYYKQAWSLSKYQVSRIDLETVVSVSFDARGFLKNYTVEKSSGDDRFDASVTQAVRSLEKLEYQPGHPVTETVRFNLKDLMNQ